MAKKIVYRVAFPINAAGTEPHGPSPDCWLRPCRRPSSHQLGWERARARHRKRKKPA